MKLIKLSETHYIVVDDSEKSEGDYIYNPIVEKIMRVTKEMMPHGQKITHSTQPLEEVCCTPENQIKRYIDCKGCDRKQLGFNKIKPLSLSEVEELIYGYSVEKMADEILNNIQL